MPSQLFKPKDLTEAIQMSVGDCKGLSAQQRWDEETPVFAEAIVRLLDDSKNHWLVDYGCGPGRIAKAIMEYVPSGDWGYVGITGVDNSSEMIAQAEAYVGPYKFDAVLPHELDASKGAELVYLVYCLQHMPAIEIRDALQRIWTCLKDDGLFFFCGSENRMAVRSDGGGFFDDRFLGVDMTAEISRVFDFVGPAIPEELMNDTVRHMISGDHPHPATLWRKKRIEGHLFNVQPGIGATSLPEEAKGLAIVDTSLSNTASSSLQKLILKNPLSPGDILVMSATLRALHAAYPNEYLTDVRSPAPAIWENSHHITPLDENDTEVTVIDMHYPEINFSGESGLHFADGHRLFLAEQLGKPIPQCGLRPDIFLTEAEKRRSPVLEKLGYDGSYVVVDAGVKSDYTLKQYYYYQEVVDLLGEEDIRCVQIGLRGPNHTHPPLTNVLNMVGQTDNQRELFSLIYNADVVVTPVSFPMHIAAALAKPCVVIALGREAARWEYYPNHQYLAVNGCLPCCPYDGCWKNKKEDCVNLADDEKYGKVPRCQLLVPPKGVVASVMKYYAGGMIGQLVSQQNTIERKTTTPNNEKVLGVLRELKPHNLGDPYLENYLSHIGKWGGKFYDIYHFIWEWFAEHAPKRILEIGTWTGNSLGQVLRAHPSPSIIEVITTIDLFNKPETSPQIVRENMRLLGFAEDIISRIEILTGRSQEILAPSLLGVLVGGQIYDFILVDGAHSPLELPRQDLDNCAPLVAPGGVLVFDDIAPDGMSLDSVWQAFKADQDENWEWFENYDGKGVGYGIRKQ